MRNVFIDTPKGELQQIYRNIIESDKQGLRPHLMDKYIVEVCREINSDFDALDHFDQSMEFGTAWRLTEKQFYEECTRRFCEE